jgi:hypothetical protein
MAIIEKHVETVCGWSLDEINERVDDLGAPHENVVIEPVQIGIGWPTTVPAIVWYEREDAESAS